MNLYCEKITNLAPGIDLSDAVNVEQLCIDISSIDMPEIPKNVSELTNDLAYTKLSVDGEASDTFEIKHVSQSEYHELVVSENGIDKNTLYIVSADSLNMYNERIENVADPESDTDAANAQYVKD